MALATLAVVPTLTAWVATAAHRGAPPAGSYSPAAAAALLITGNDAETQRRAVLARAALRPAAGGEAGHDRSSAAAGGDRLACRFRAGAPSGTSAKFDCVLDGGEIVKVKYGRNPELQAESAATQLLRALGYAVDRVDMVSRLRCYGCPRFPFVTMKLLTLAGAADALAPNGYADRFTDFAWVTVERRFPAPAVETEGSTGWAWWELDRVAAPLAERDALKLLAIFLAHWDNKASNQRLVCLDTPPPAAGSDCLQPLAMLQDLGATFGPPKVNLARWRDLPIWEDRATCTVSMALLPWGGATFPRARISDAGRALLAQRLASVDDAALRQIFLAARFPQYQAGTSDERDLEAWRAAFRHRQAQIATAQCPMRNA